MKKICFCFVILVMIITFGCSSVNSSADVDNKSELSAESLNSQYESLLIEFDVKESEVESLKSALDEAEGKFESAEAEKELIYEEYDDYKAVMSEYEGLSEEEAEARLVIAESINESESYRKESEAEAERVSLEAKEKLGYETGITYNNLARNPDDYIGEKVKFKGKVVQIMEGTGSYNQLRLMVDNDYDKILYCEYDKDLVSSRILDNDKITIYGTSYGLYSYESTGAGTITIPAVVADKIDQ